MRYIYIYEIYIYIYQKSHFISLLLTVRNSYNLMLFQLIYLFCSFALTNIFFYDVTTRISVQENILNQLYKHWMLFAFPFYKAYKRASRCKYFNNCVKGLNNEIYASFVYGSGCQTDDDDSTRLLLAWIFPTLVVLSSHRNSRVAAAPL